jgi:hypothetical protein
LGLRRSAALGNKQDRTAKAAIRLEICLWLAAKYESRHLILGGGFFYGSLNRQILGENRP